ncbi:uncharacterized protein [Diadema setosum]|uniref:uncharacterized protein n=1 Tax=Diadema setosum TaxID=31175 RepID=UPI003B3AE77F
MEIASSVVDTAPTVRVWKRGSIRLLCHFEEEPLAVFWVKESSSNQQLETRKASFFDGNFASKSERFDIDENYSLVISDVHVEDEGSYHCQLVLGSFEVFLNSTFLSVIYPAVDTLPTIQGWRGADIRLPCDFQDEPFAVYWVKESMTHPELSTSKAFYDGNFVSMAARFDIDRNFNLIITDLEVADEGLFHCQVVLPNFENFENSTLMTVSSVVSRHEIEECVDESQQIPSQCTYHTPSDISYFNLTCVVSGFKPNISMLWTQESGKRLYSVVSQQTTLTDNTYERFEIITVSAKLGAEQTFMCTATGDSLNGRSTTEITVLPISEESGDVLYPVISQQTALSSDTFERFETITVSAKHGMEQTFTCTATGDSLNETSAAEIIVLPLSGYGGKSDNLGLAIGLGIGISVVLIIAFLLVGKYLQKYHPHYLPRKVNSLQKKRDGLRRKIRDYLPGMTFYDTHLKTQSKVNIGVFGEIGAGKSSLINSLIFALHDLAGPIIFVTHKNEYPDVKAVRQDIYSFFRWWYKKPTILMFENYTQANYEEDVEKDIAYLEFLWEALKRCDWMHGNW